MRKSSILASAVIGSGFLASGALAASIGINFSGGSFGTPAPLAATDIAGVVPQQNWNNEGGNAGSAAAGTVVDSSGVSLPAVTVTWNSNNTWSNNDQGFGGANNALLSNYLDGGSGGPATVTIANIPYTHYDVYIYTQRDSATNSDYTLNGVTQNVNVAGSGFYNANGFVLDTATQTGDYLVFSGETSATISLISSQTTVRSPIDGIQIVQTTPEPASLGLVGLGVAGMMARRRRA